MDSDSDLARRAKEGETTAFHELVNRHAGALHRLAFFLVGQPQNAEDILQETFLGAFRNLATFQGRSSVKTWLIRILINQVAKYRRYGRIRKVTALADIPHQAHPVHPPPAHDVRFDVEAAMQALSPEHREVIVLRELQGFSYAEIATLLDVPRGTVESRLNRARRILREALKDHFPATDPVHGTRG